MIRMFFTGTIEAISKIVNKVYKAGDDKESIAFRVLADHIRAISFTIADGQLPSNTGAGYVIRRILRRAVRYYYSYLDFKQPLLHQLLPVIAKQFENVFPELNAQLDFVSKVVKEEEDAFLRTLGVGLSRINVIMYNKSEEIKKELISKGYSIDSTNVDSSTLAERFSTPEADEIRKKHKVIDGKSAFELHDTFGFPKI
ncbi:MAG: alanine--tRNA ligase-related protein [Ferruginibacter sp.]